MPKSSETELLARDAKRDLGAELLASVDELKAEQIGRVSVFGLLAGRTRKVASIEEMNEAAAEGWAGKE